MGSNPIPYSMSAWFPLARGPGAWVSVLVPSYTPILLEDSVSTASGATSHSSIMLELMDRARILGINCSN